MIPVNHWQTSRMPNSLLFAMKAFQVELQQTDNSLREAMGPHVLVQLGLNFISTGQGMGTPINTASEPAQPSTLEAR
jgi:hypothetical protein